MAPAKTGSLKINKTAVIPTAHKNKGTKSKENLYVEREQIIVDKKLIAPKIELIPAKCKLKIAISTEIPEWNLKSDKGG